MRDVRQSRAEKTTGAATKHGAAENKKEFLTLQQGKPLKDHKAGEAAAGGLAQGALVVDYNSTAVQT